MAVAFKTALGTAVSAASTTTLVITTTAAIAIGDLVVVRVAADNLSATTPTMTCADSGGNTYSSRAFQAVNATGAAGVAGGILCSKATVAVASSGTITITFSGAIVAKAATAASFTGCENTARSTFVSTSGTTTALVSGTSGTVNAGDLVLAHGAYENNDTVTGDSDTTNGSWSTAVTLASAAGGTATARVTTTGQYKIVTAAGTQAYNATLNAATDWVGMIAVLQATPVFTQPSFRWRNDDGSETTATWKAAQDTNTSLDLATPARLRLVVTSDIPATATPTLYYKKTSSGTWLPVPVGAGGGDPIYVVASANITAGGEATTRQLSSSSPATTDAFTYSNGTLSTVSGGLWVAVAHTLFEAPLVVSNAVGGASVDKIVAGVRTDAPADTTNHYSEVDVTLGSDFNLAGAMCRAVHSGATLTQGYLAGWNTDGGGTYAVTDFVNDISIASVAGVGVSGTKRIRLECVGTNLKMFVNGTQVLSGTDSTYTTGTDVGFASYHGATGTVFDNWAGGDLYSLGYSFTGTNGSAWDPAVWESTGVAATSVVDIQSNAGRMLSQGADYTYSRAMSASSWAATDVTFSVSFNSASEAYFLTYVRSSATWGSSGDPAVTSDGYMVEYAVADGTLTFYWSVGGARQFPELDQATVGSSAAKRWIRIQAIGSALKAKTWLDGGAEPGTWDIEATQATHTSGRIAFAFVNGAAGAGTATVDDFAPFSAGRMWDDENGTDSVVIS